MNFSITTMTAIVSFGVEGVIFPREDVEVLCFKGRALDGRFLVESVASESKLRFGNINLCLKTNNNHTDKEDSNAVENDSKTSGKFSKRQLSHTGVGWRNSPTIALLDLEDNRRKINVKLSVRNAHVCGAKSESVVMSVVGAILTAIGNSRSVVQFAMEMASSQVLIDQLKCNWEQLTNYEIKCQPTIVSLLKTEFETLENVVLFTEKISATPKLAAIAPHATPSVKNCQCRVVMVNHNHDLGFPVSLRRLCSFMRASAFNVRFDEILDHKLIATPSSDDCATYGKSTLLVYRTGAVTQSGISLNANHAFAQQFEKILNAKQKEIELPARNRDPRQVNLIECPPQLLAAGVVACYVRHVLRKRISTAALAAQIGRSAGVVNAYAARVAMLTAQELQTKRAAKSMKRTEIFIET